jgi:uncharacterized protein (DUF983 family)
MISGLAPVPPSGRAPSLTRLLARGLVRRCPACSQGHLFRRWFTMAERCPRCGLQFERIEGHWIGAIGINTIVTFGLLLVSTVVGLVATFPEFPVLPLILVNVAVAVIVPLAFYPFSRTLWTGLDIAMRPLEPYEVDWTQVRA